MYMTAFRLRYERARNQRFYLITSDISNNLCKFNVMGSTGNVYTVLIDSEKDTCTCPDYLGRKQHCKHIIFVLNMVLSINIEDIFMRNYNPDSIKTYAENHDIFTQFTSDSLIERFNKINISKSTDSEVKQKMNQECAICFEKINHEKDKIVYCKYVCGNSVHKECFNRWSTIKPNQCVYCRGMWTKESESKYINLYKS